MATDSQKCKFELFILSSSGGQSKTTETTEVKTKTECMKCMFCQNNKSEKIVTPS